ncbi:3-oxoacyl-ACP synthase [Streptomyces sp. CB00455]|uniref:beta-ketoacyl-[acyl-carrier-protein] synthase family protein n=1 Tax=Streptomyces sp. CB00455 TaxID=1703927 RepID=UPI00093E85C8|nr:beta-ketoacyl-[acyl-carrier-protein] synthase family protein [Streptomyces sp. CB00455]OKK14740.1 3-oxoacyl-ACP synthase [Streptomyces sp. CB00455]
MSAFAAAITGIGLVTPAGIGVKESWDRVIDGKPTAAHHADLAGLPVTMACRVPDFEPGRLGLRGSWQWDRYAQFAIAAAREALEQAGLIAGEWADSSRVAVVLGSGAGGTATLEEQHRVLIEEGPSEVSPMTLPMGLLNMAAGQVAIDIGANGPCMAPCTACAAGASAIGLGRELLRSGLADIVVAGGAEAPVTPLYLSSFARMRALSRRTDDPQSASRPFDAHRDGFVLGEGAGVVVLETEDHARARGVRPVARVIGYGASADAHHVTSPHPEGKGAELAVRAALADAGLSGRDIGYVNAHGTSTPLNDVIEAAVIRRVVGPGAQVSSTKGVTGHPLGAAGSIEAAFAALTVHHGIVPPTASTTEIDPRVEVDVVHGAARRGPVEVALSNSFGFGGQNAALLIASA